MKKNGESLLHFIYFSIHCLIWVLFPLILRAQSINPPKIWQTNRFGQEHGLLQLNVKGMALDSLGFLWVGTEDGLHRFNGYEFKSYIHNPNDSTSIKDDHIRGLLYIDNTLWMATTAQGIGAYLPSKDRFFNPVLKAGSDEIKTSFRVLKHDDQTLLFSVLNHLISYNIWNQNSAIIDLPVSEKTSYVTDVLHLGNNKCWLSSTASGILEIDTESMEFSTLPFLKNSFINCLAKINNSIYIGTETGLYEYQIKTGKVRKTNLPNPTNCFHRKNDSELYIGTDNGMFLFNLDLNEITPIILKVSENKIYESVDINQILGDDKGNLWIGTEGDGLLYYNKYQIKFNSLKISLNEYPLTADISAFQILKVSDQTLFFGTKLGVVEYDFSTKLFKLFPSTKDILIYTLKRDKKGQIWAGGFTSGLLKYDAGKKDFVEIKPKEAHLADRDLIEINPLDSTTLLVCTWSGGIYTYDTHKNELQEHRIAGKKINRARISFLDSKQNIWLGTDEGAYKLGQNGTVTKYSTNTQIPLSGDRVFAINEDRYGNIWIGTNVGLTRINNKLESEFYYKQKGLPNDFIYSILIDKENSIWVSTNYGLSVLDQETNKFINYTSSDGLQNNEFNGKAGYEDEDGFFYFGGISGINVFQPEEINENPILPTIFIESVDLFNIPINRNELFKNSLTFKSQENVLTFNYSALNYLNPEKCDYQYKMEGFDEDWRPVTKDRNTTYTNLNPGNYSFIVKATNDAGIWNESPAKMHITIIPPWYETNLFKGIFIIAFLLSGIIFYFYQTRKLKRAKLKLEKIVSHRTSQVKEKNKKLEMAFSEVEHQRDNIAFLMRELRHRVKNNLQIISSLLNIQSNSIESQSAKEALKMAKNRIIAISQIENKISGENENIDIGEFIKDISFDITQVLSEEKDLKYKLHVQSSTLKLKNINTTLLGLILNELITNATKYAFNEFNAENSLQINFSASKSMLFLTIEDNGKGYDPNRIKTNSLGLELVHDMVSQMGGQIEIENHNGTKYQIKIPLAI